ncbi:DUF4383 domain-containing protein [Paenibacillus pinihumi]|uniref:DUF4383 domain-containing protein n=1 Tax=Paenibacillus pinihumi TaxID=669462 RepID=UPI00041294AD|nr:DUF4383 domain-containing protein [Paenibacillus pinihumi]
MAIAVRRFAALSGIVLLLLGTLGFFTSHLFGLFHLDVTHSVVHLVFGVLGVLAASHNGYAYRYAQVLGIVFIVLAVLGFFIKDLFGLMAVGLSDNVLHFIIGAAGLYFGYVMVESQAPSRYSKTV